MGKRSVEVAVTLRQQVLLKRITPSKKAAQQLVERCRVVLLWAAGLHNEAQAEEFGVDRQRIRRWRRTRCSTSAHRAVFFQTPQLLNLRNMSSLPTNSTSIISRTLDFPAAQSPRTPTVTG